MNTRKGQRNSPKAKANTPKQDKGKKQKAKKQKPNRYVVNGDTAKEPLGDHHEP
ncbi:hypothetical protein [Paraburkholderia sp. GAS334]|uniref:hypothetical protein n=1 Tax=Paraburkholderia sp. GAS334 TaxID=3035131 RepID=UPI003D25524A